ncbi:hypothetical protein [Promicromonospora iranensis]|uniref:Uncharacterized protein n=1 Tax=Promicromonospora iranensis TaxID=1105144 RepID=A0ABU2CPU2_9MICO|nr:hypothetical protein [Promicromonospora iranensis]MDR7383367.1 hypothetical protein [Promicromonospora iranensis]
MTSRELIALCESRINGLSRTRQAFEHSSVPEHVDGLIDDLRVAASGWGTAVSRPPDGDPVALRVGARTVRDGVPGFDAMADVLEVYASALESGQARHAAGVSHLRAARQCAAGLAEVGGADPDRTEATSRAAIAVLDLACAGYVACQDAYEAVRDAERALYAALSHVRARPPGHRSSLSV